MIQVLLPYITSAAFGFFVAVCFYFIFGLELGRRLADVFWIVVGGLGAGTAILFSGYRSNSIHLDMERHKFFLQSRSAIDSTVPYFRSHCNRSSLPMPSLGYDSTNPDYTCKTLMEKFESAFIINESKSPIEINKKGEVEKRYALRGCEELQSALRQEECEDYKDYRKKYEERSDIGIRAYETSDVSEILSEAAPLSVYETRDDPNASVADSAFWKISRGLDDILTEKQQLKNLEFNVNRDRVFSKYRHFALIVFAFIFPLRMLKSLFDLFPGIFKRSPIWRRKRAFESS